MEQKAMRMCAVLAEGFRYPRPGHVGSLRSGAAALPHGSARMALTAFVEQVGRLSLGEWEELHTRTLDLNPPVAPYVGYQTWGESYSRGPFLARLGRELCEAGVDTDGELPDHLAPVLRYLGRISEPLPGLVELCGQAIERMLGSLRRAEPANPYVRLLEAAAATCQVLQAEVAAREKETR